VVVRADTILLAKGYGYADMDRRIPVDATKTGFRPGSVSKLFTATAVLQLVEDGKLELDRDINDYLDFRIASPFSTPITLRHLLTHSAGFDQVIKGLGYIDPSLVVPLDNYVKRFEPPVVYPPGSTPSYSNYGVVLAGYIVQRISGVPFEDYIDRKIFAPLQMTRSTFRQPLPSDLEPAMSRGYLVSSGSPQPFEILGTMPAGGATTTGLDMARFMMAHLRGGELGGARILRPETVLLMHGPADSPQGPPGFGGMALGFMHNGNLKPRRIGHGGDTIAFHAGLTLFLDAGIGLYIAVNSQGAGTLDGNGVVTAFTDDFGDRFLPTDAEPTPAPTPSAATHAALASGRYLSSRHFQKSFLSLLNLRTDRVSADQDGTITIPSITDRFGRPKAWREVGPWLWQEVGGADQLAMTLENGQVASIRRSGEAPTILLRARGARTAWWNIPLLIVTVLVLAAEVLRQATQGVKRVLRRRRDAAPKQSTTARVGRFASLVAAATIAGWLMLFKGLLSGDVGLLSGTRDLMLRALQLGGATTIVLGPAVIAATIVAIRRGDQGTVSTLWSALVCGATLAVVWFAIAFHLLGPRLMY
jgi:CubicO group peptidase (beta-lactamase class C family)